MTHLIFNQGGSQHAFNAVWQEEPQAQKQALLLTDCHATGLKWGMGCSQIWLLGKNEKS